MFKRSIRFNSCRNFTNTRLTNYMPQFNIINKMLIHFKYTTKSDFIQSSKYNQYSNYFQYGKCPYCYDTKFIECLECYEDGNISKSHHDIIVKHKCNVCSNIGLITCMFCD